jgi:hypothetical protein
MMGRSSRRGGTQARFGVFGDVEASFLARFELMGGEFSAFGDVEASFSARFELMGGEFNAFGDDEASFLAAFALSWGNLESVNTSGVRSSWHQTTGACPLE